MKHCGTPPPASQQVFMQTSPDGQSASPLGHSCRLQAVPTTQMHSLAVPTWCEQWQPSPQVGWLLQKVLGVVPHPVHEPAGAEPAWADDPRLYTAGAVQATAPTTPARLIMVRREMPSGVLISSSIRRSSTP
jgi:hypothetical protein